MQTINTMASTVAVATRMDAPLLRDRRPSIQRLHTQWLARGPAIAMQLATLGRMTVDAARRFSRDLGPAHERTGAMSRRRLHWVLTEETYPCVQSRSYPYGPPEVLRLEEFPDPVPGPGEVRVRVRAAGVQPVDCAVRQGWFRNGGPFEVRPPQILGNEFAGVVDQVGRGPGLRPWR